MKWESVIGLEIHVQLSTQSKIFSSSPCLFGAAQNTQANLIDLGFPGVLPVLNKEAVHKAIRFGLAIGAEISRKTIFARKNYFYPDLPKGYQISQLDDPIVGKGYLDIQVDGVTKRIGVTRAHLEEDAGKSMHTEFPNASAIDLNRAGTPLLEIVSDPDMRSAKEAIAYLKQIHTLVRYLDISDGNMAEGSFRCDANISIRPAGATELGTRTELKNINSFKFVEKAINIEIQRQIELIEDGGKVIQQTRLYDAEKNETRAMRSKEEANDYRYFPDPDLLPLVIENRLIEEIRSQLPELPKEKQTRFENSYGLNAYDASLIAQDKNIANFFELCSQMLTQKGNEKLIANWINGEIAAQLNKEERSFELLPISAKQLSELIDRIADGTISSKMARRVFESLWSANEPLTLSVDTIIKQQGLQQVSDSSALEQLVLDVINSNPDQVANYTKADETKRGKMLGFFVGQIMKASKGQANPQQLNEILLKKLNSL